MQCRCGAPVYRDNTENLNEDFPCQFCGTQICGICHGKHFAEHPNEREGKKPYRRLTWRDLKRR